MIRLHLLVKTITICLFVFTGTLLGSQGANTHRSLQGASKCTENQDEVWQHCINIHVHEHIQNVHKQIYTINRKKKNPCMCLQTEVCESIADIIHSSAIKVLLERGVCL